MQHEIYALVSRAWNDIGILESNPTLFSEIESLFHFEKYTP